jgi:hypothetical protein
LNSGKWTFPRYTRTWADIVEASVEMPCGAPYVCWEDIKLLWKKKSISFLWLSAVYLTHLFDSVRT